MINLNQIRNKLIEAIKNSGLTQTEIARRLNIKPPTVAQYISGRAMPALDTFANLCAILDADPADILCLSEYDGNDNKKAVRISDSFNNNSGNINFKN